MTAYDRLSAALEAAGRTVRDTGPGRLVAQCPGHDDRNPSLSVTAIEGSVLLYCHAGCAVAQVLDGLGWSAADLYDNTRGADYLYPGGRRVHRTPAKGFSQSGNRKDRSLFHADRIAAAVEVLVVEGEKDVLAAEAAGAAAVCPAMGAGKAHRFDWSPLAGKRVTVVADDDQPGRRHAAEVVEQLADAGAVEVRVVRAAVGNDLADHIAAGHPLDALVPLDVSPPSPPSRVALTRLADVTPERVSWLWPGYIPRGKLVTLDGDPGLGKSTLALSITGPVTTGGRWPDGSRCDYPGAVLLLSAEDGLADTVRPRLDAAGADVTRVHAIQGVPEVDRDGNVGLRPPTLGDIAALREAIVATGAALLIVDVLMAYLPTGSDAHKDQDVRAILGRLTKLAEDTGCTIVLIRHLNKSAGRDPLYRGGGSIGIVGAGRVALLVAPDPDDDDRRVLAGMKSNLGPLPAALAYRLVSSGDYEVARVQWEGAVGHTARSLLSERNSPEEADAATEAQMWLEDYLAQHGSARSADVKRDAAKLKISERTLQRAAEKLAVTARSEGFPRVTWWSLPSPASDDNTPGTQNLGATGATGRDQRKQVGATGAHSRAIGATVDGPLGATGATGRDQRKHTPETVENPQSRQAACVGATEPPGGITERTPGMTAAVERALAGARAAGRFTTDPPCYYCDKPVTSKHQDGRGRYVHLGCQPGGSEVAE